MRGKKGSESEISFILQTAVWLCKAVLLCFLPDKICRHFSCLLEGKCCACA